MREANKAREIAEIVKDLAGFASREISPAKKRLMEEAAATILVMECGFRETEGGLAVFLMRLKEQHGLTFESVMSDKPTGILQ